MNKTPKRKHSLSLQTNLTSYQWAMIKRMSIQDLVSLYNDDPKIFTSPEFFLNVKPAALELILRDLFSSDNQDRMRQRGKKIRLIEMLKAGTGLIELMMKNPEVGRRIFGFIKQRPINQVCLDIFGEIFITYARRCPNKLLCIIKEPEVQHQFSKNTRKFQIFQIVYTMVFCLNQKTCHDQSQLIEGIIFSLINVVFQNQQGISIYDPSYWEQQPDKQQMMAKQESNKKQIIQSQKSIQESGQSQKPIQNKLIKRISFLDPQQIFSKAQINKFFTNTLHNYQHQLQAMQETICNVSDMLKQVCKNVKEIYKGNLYTLVNLMVQQNYVSRLFIILNLIRKFIIQLCSKQTGKAKEIEAKDHYEQIQNGIYELLYNIILVYHSFDNEEQKHSSSMENIAGTQKERKKEDKKEEILSLGKIQEKSPKKIKKNEKQCFYEQKIKHSLLLIINQINHGLINQWIQSKPYQRYFQRRIPQTSGMNIKTIKMSRYWIIKILLEIFEIFQNSRSQVSKLIDLDSTASDILNYIKQCIEINKWNNIMQNQLLKLIQTFLDSHYETFVKEIQNEQVKFSETLLGIIITNFRNKDHYFLDTMRKCVQGDQQFLFKVGQYISGKMSQQGDIKRILAKHETWKSFFHKDLKSYENILNQKNVFSEERYPELQMKKIKSANDTEYVPIERPIQTIKQMIDDIEDNRKWRTSQKSPIFPTRRRKQSFTTTQAIKQIDSLRNFELSPKK